MLNNRVDKLVLKAFLECPFPDVLKSGEPELFKHYAADLASLANRLLMGRNERIEILKLPILSKEDKQAMNNLISSCTEEAKKCELVFFSRLAILVESLLIKYRA